MKINVISVLTLKYFNDVVFERTSSLSIKGVVKKQGVNIPCRVRLYDRVSGQLVSDILSDSSGNYEFKNLTKIPFFLVAHDPLAQKNAVISDMVVPK